MIIEEVKDHLTSSPVAERDVLKPVTSRPLLDMIMSQLNPPPSFI
jgi:hypothetical protein